MASSCSQSDRRASMLTRLWIDDNVTHGGQLADTPASTLSLESESYRDDGAYTVAGSNDVLYSNDVFHVLCLYDFNAGDDNQLSFKKNDVLDVVKQEANGWWAAVRPGSTLVGWIPSSFVEPLSEVQVQKFSCRPDPRIQEHTCRIYGSPLSPRRDERPPWSPGDQFSGDEWPPSAVDVEAPITLFGSRHLDSIHGQSGPDDHWPVQGVVARFRASSSIRSQPPSRSFSLSASDMLSHPPCAAALSRQARRRPVLIDDSSSLCRLSMLFETNNVEELSSPEATQHFDSFSRIPRCETTGPRPTRRRSKTWGPQDYVQRGDSFLEC